MQEGRKDGKRDYATRARVRVPLLGGGGRLQAEEAGAVAASRQEGYKTARSTQAATTTGAAAPATATGKLNTGSD